MVFFPEKQGRIGMVVNFSTATLTVVADYGPGELWRDISWLREGKKLRGSLG